MAADGYDFREAFPLPHFRSVPQRFVIRRIDRESRNVTFAPERHEHLGNAFQSQIGVIVQNLRHPRRAGANFLRERSLAEAKLLHSAQDLILHVGTKLFQSKDRRLVFVLRTNFRLDNSMKMTTTFVKFFLIMQP